MQIRLNGRTVAVEPGETYETVVRREYGWGSSALGIRVGGCTIPLGAPPSDGADAAILQYATKEGRRIYERSLQFVFLMAAREVIPGVRIRIENSTSAGLYAHTPGTKLTARNVEAIGRRSARTGEKRSAVCEKGRHAGGSRALF
jgi:uridine kinase